MARCQVLVGLLRCQRGTIQSKTNAAALALKKSEMAKFNSLYPLVQVPPWLLKIDERLLPWFVRLIYWFTPFLDAWSFVMNMHWRSISVMRLALELMLEDIYHSSKKCQNTTSKFIRNYETWNSWFKIQYLGLSRHFAIFFSWWLFFPLTLMLKSQAGPQETRVSKASRAISVSEVLGWRERWRNWFKTKGIGQIWFEIWQGLSFWDFFLCGATEGEKTFRSSWWPSKELNFIVNSQLFCLIYDTCDVSLGVHSRLRWMKMEGNSGNLKGIWFKEQEIPWNPKSWTRRKERWQRRVKRQGGLGRREKGRGPLRSTAWLRFRSSVPICHHRVRHAYPLISHLTCFVQGFDFNINQWKTMDILDNWNLRTKCCH